MSVHFNSLVLESLCSDYGGSVLWLYSIVSSKFELLMLYRYLRILIVLVHIHTFDSWIFYSQYSKFGSFCIYVGQYNSTLLTLIAYLLLFFFITLLSHFSRCLLVTSIYYISYVFKFVCCYIPKLYDHFFFFLAISNYNNYVLPKKLPTWQKLINEKKKIVRTINDKELKVPLTPLIKKIVNIILEIFL